MRDDPLGLDPLGLDDPLELETKKKSPSVGRQLVDASKGTVQALGDMASSVAKFPVQVGAAAIGKIKSPQHNLKELFDAAGEELNARFPAFGDESNLAYKNIMTPFRKYDEYVVQPVAKGVGNVTGSKDMQGAAEVIMNVAPVPFAGRAGRALKRGVEMIDPQLHDRPPIKKTELPTKPVEADPLGLDTDVAGNAAMQQVQRTVAPDAPSLAAGDKLPTATPAPWNVLVDDLGRTADNNRFANADQAMAARQAAMEAEMRQRVALEQQARLRKQQENAPTGYNDWLMDKATQEAAATHSFVSNLKQVEIDPTEHVMPDTNQVIAPQYGAMQGEGRFDENGIPIRADLSMEAANLENPLQRNLWGDELDTPTGDGGIPLTQALDSMPAGAARNTAVQQLGGMGRGMRRTQGGGIDFEGISSSLSALGKTLRPTLLGIPKEDTVTTPRSAETIAQKKALAAKARAVGYEGSVYERVTTPEEVLADPGKDISNNPVRDYVKPGVEGMIRTNSDNRLLKFARTKFQDARNAAEKFSRTYVTGDDGINKTYRKLSQAEFIPVAEAMQEASRQRTPLTLDMMREMGFNEKQIAFATKAREAFDAMYAMGNDVLMQQGFEPFKYHEGYVPSMFSGAYTAVLTDAKGRKGIAQADTKAGMQKAIEYYKELGYTNPVVLPRRGLKDTTYKSNRVYDGFNDIINTIAKNDPEFANLKAEVDQRVAESAKRLYQFDVHEKTKTGARGSLGDRPWLSREENAKQFLEGMINYLEEGSRYYTQQGAMTEVGKLTNNPDLAAKMPNTLKYLDRYTKHVTGKNLSPVGAAANWMLDAPWAAIGVGPKIPANVANKLKTWSTIHMMGVFNVGFMAAQLTQPLTGGLPEATKIASTMGLPATTIAKSFTDIPFNISKVVFQVEGGKDMGAPEHLVGAYQFAKDAGMFVFSESELAHEVMQSKYLSNLEKGLSWPISWGEKATRPPVFMWFTDLFYQSGLRGEELYKTAQTATDYAMANYHPDERPMLYSSLGTMGQFMGALTTYKHNLLDQFTSRTLDAKKGQVAPAAVMLGIAYTLYGLSGMPGYQEADEIVQRTTDKTIRNIAFDSMPHESLWDGLLSASTGIDFQSRLSMASVLPDDVGTTLSPQISNFWDITAKAMDYAKNGDLNSQVAAALAATPAGLRGATEASMNTDADGYVLNKYGQRKYDVPRSESEQTTRAITGLRPLNERVTDEATYAIRKAEARRMDKLKDASGRMESALIRGDMESLNKFAQVYIDNGGDISQVLSQRQIESFLVKGKMSEKQRKQGIPSDNLNSINRYKAYQE